MSENIRGTETVSVAAVRLGVDRLTAYKSIREGTFPVPVIRVGRRILVPTAALDRLLEGAEELRRSRAASNLPPTVADRDALRRVAALLAATSPGAEK